MNDRLEKIAEDMATPDGLVDFADYDTIRSGILESARKSVEESFPVANDRYGIRLTNTRYVGPEIYTRKDQKDALMHHKSLTRRMVGDWQVYDTVSGQPLGDVKSRTVMHVPWLTDRGTFIRNGVDMVPIKQLRLNSSIYTRKTDDGHVESQFNPVARKGRAFRTFMDPKTSHFYMNYKNRKVPLYPVLKAMGVKDDEMKKTWGDEILETNKTLERSPYAVSWLKQFAEVPQQKQATINVEPPVPDHEILKQNLLTEFTATQMDPDNTQATTGKRFDRVTPEALLTSTHRILKVHRGEEDTDDRDSLQFQGLYDYSDYLSEAIKNDHDGVVRKLLWKIAGKNGDSSAIQPGHLDKYVNYLYDTSLLQGPEEISPIDVYDQNQRVTRLGPGAMSSLDVVPMEARAVQPSYLGYVDPVRAPECYVSGMEALTSVGWVKWSEVTADHEFACKVDDVTTFAKPIRLISHYVSEDVYTYDDPDIAYAVTHNHRMWAAAGRRKSSFEIIDARTAHMRYLTVDVGLDDFRSCELAPAGYSIAKYTGTVYCAEVPGGLLYVRTPGRKGFWCGNSMKVGVDMKFARGVRKGPGNQMYTTMVDPKTGQKRWVSARKAASSVVALPDMLKTDDQFVPAIDGKGVMGYVDRKTVDYVVPSGGDMFSNSSNMVPMIGGIKGMRLLMAAKHFNSALPLVNRESPLVITTAEDGSANEDAMSEVAGAVRAKKPGTVKQVRRDGIIVENSDGTETKYDVYDNFPYARSTYVRNTPSVKAGDKVDKNGLLATSNYTDDKGRFSGGVNLNTAFMNYHGYSISGREYVYWTDEEGAHYTPLNDVPSGSPISSQALDCTDATAHAIPVHAVIEHATSDAMMRVTTVDGMEAFGTANHSFMTINDDGAVVEIYPSDMIPGKTLVPIMRPVRAIVSPDTLSFEKTVGHSHAKSLHGVPVDEDLGWFLGLYVAEGNIGGGRHICIAVTEDEIAQRLMRTVVAWDGDVSISRFKNTCVIYNAALARWLEKECGNGAFNKKVPDVVMGAPDTVVRGFVDGYWCGDGTVTKELTAATVSHRLAEGLCFLLGSIGIRATKRKYKISEYLDNPRYMDQYTIKVRSFSYDNFPHITLTRKNDRLEALKGAVRAWSTDRIPVPFSEREQTARAIGRRQIRHDSGTVSRCILKKHLDKLPPITRKYVEAPLWWDIVKSVEEAEFEPVVYDLDMRPYGTFAIGSGWIVHNTFEDGVAISESAAKKMTSEHMYAERLDNGDDLIMDKRKYATLFPGRFDKKQLATIDDDGVVKPGTVLNYGDPMFLSYKHVPPSPETAGRRVNQEAGRVWEHHYPAVVTDAGRGKKGWQILARSNQPMQVGDKLCYAPDTDVLTSLGWKPVADVTLDDRVATLSEDGSLEYVEPVAIHTYAHKGRMYSLETTQVNMLVTPDHYNYVSGKSNKKYKLRKASDHFGQCVRMKRDAIWHGNVTDSEVCFPQLRVTAGQSGNGYRMIPELRMSMTTYLMLLGMYLSEGSIVDQPGSGDYGIDISQIGHENRVKMLGALDEAGVRYTEAGNDTKVRIYGKQLMMHFRQFGKCHEKFMPTWVFELPTEKLNILYDWLTWGDGHTGTTHRSYSTTSPRLADDFQRLCLHVGKSGTIKTRPATTGYINGTPYDFRELYVIHALVKKNRPTINHCHTKDQSGQQERWVDYDGTVHCVSMPVNHVIYTRRGGKPVWSGNCGRYGNKGTVAKIIPDPQMPTDESGQRIDLLLNANGIPTRTNPAQAMEMALAKHARATGKPIQVGAFDDMEDLQDRAQRLLDEVGLKDRETIYDPVLGKKIPKVYTGPMYIFKQSHTSDKGGKARSTAAYTAEGLPAKGGSSGSKHYGSMEQESLLAYGAEGLLKDIKLIKGQRNDNFWRDVRAGRTPTIPDSPYVYDKFRELLKGAGINLREEKDADHIFAMTNDQVKEMTGNRKLQSGSTFRAVDMHPIAGGLFDPEIIGSNGKLWGYVELPEPMLNPIAEDPIRSLLDVRKVDLEDIMTGRTAVEGKRGGHGLKAALEQLNVRTIKKEALEAIKEGSKSKRDAAVKRYSYAHAMEEAGIQPKDLMWDRVPVLPPTYRPITNVNGMNMVADPNYMYKALIDGIEDYRDAADTGVGEEAMQEARKTMVDNVRALIGTADPVQEKLQQKNVGGILAQIVGKGSPKHCYDDETDILTEDGWMKFKDYKGQSKVATVHPMTHGLEYHTPSDIIHEHYEGDMIRLDFRGKADLLVTPNHRNWVRLKDHIDNSDMNRGWNFMYAEDMLTCGTRMKMLRTAEGFRGSFDIPSYVQCTPEEFAEFAGWWLAEGWIHSGGASVDITQTPTEGNKGYCDRIDYLVKSLGLQYSYGEYAHGTNTDGYRRNSDHRKLWSIKDKRLVEWCVNNLGQGATNKKLSRKILKEWDASMLLSLLKGYLRGDGKKSPDVRVQKTSTKHRYNTGIYDHQSFNTTSKRLVDDLMELGCKAGVPMKLYKTETYPEHPTRNTQYKVSVYTNRYATAEGKGKYVHKVPYDGGIHCVTVPNGLIVVRRNGLTCVSGNSLIQRRLLGTNIDIAGQAVITPNPALKLDQVGLPERQAWDLYEPYIVRELVRLGYKTQEASDMVERKSKPAYEALKQVITERPIIYNRAPTLHKYSIMGAWPVLTKGSSLQIHPAVVKPFNADFDGDKMSFTVPTTQEAVRDVIEKMMPGKNLLLSERDDKPLFQLQNEYVQGLWAATKKPRRTATKKFATMEDAKKAYAKGEIQVDDPIIIENRR